MEPVAHSHLATAEMTRRPVLAKLLGLATLTLVAGMAGRQLARTNDKEPLPVPDMPDVLQPVRRLHAAAALLGVSVLADSAIAHWRGSFANPGMFAPLLSSLMTITVGTASANGRPSQGKRRRLRGGAYAMATASGVAGTGFHVYNVLRRPGGLSWMNLFYAAPLGAPAALSLAGLLGLSAQRLSRQSELVQRVPGLPAGRLLAALTAVGIGGTAGEAALLHFRGAFQNPFMWLPVSVPPLASLLMARAAVSAPQPDYVLARALLNTTAALGIAGVGFHAYGVSRQMGGWRNTRQNLLSGPPLPAPPAFLALALAGGAALSLLEARSQAGQCREKRR